MKKFFKEFKEFINKGNVMDLAVGMIIGSAFTAIVTALVNNILKPLINWIPGADGTSALQTVLREAVTDSEGNIITEALILDWGAVISAIITFILTALVLFVIIKSVNRVRETGKKVKSGVKDALDKSKKEEEAPVAEEAPAVEEAPVVEETPKETSEELLKQIIEILKDKEAK